jgi:hypothetical protein
MLKGLKLTWYNLMSYKYRDIVLKNGNVILGHYYFDMSEPIVIEEYSIKFDNIGSEENFPQKCFESGAYPTEYYDGHLVQSFLDIKHNKPGVIASEEKINQVKKKMESEKDDIAEFLDEHMDLYREQIDADEPKKAVGVDWCTLFIPAVDPRDDFKDDEDRTIDMITKATNNMGGGIFGNFKLEPLHVALIIGGLAIVTKLMGYW